MPEKFAATKEAMRHASKMLLIILTLACISYFFDPVGAIYDLMRGEKEEVDWAEFSQTLQQQIDTQVQYLEGDGSSLSRSELRASMNNATNESLTNVMDSKSWNPQTQSIVLNRLASEYIENVFALPIVCGELEVDATRFADEYARLHEREWSLFRNSKFENLSDVDEFFVPMMVEKKYKMTEIFLQREALENGTTVDGICRSLMEEPLENAENRSFFTLHPDWYGLTGLFRPEDHPEMPKHLFENKSE